MVQGGGGQTPADRRHARAPRALHAGGQNSGGPAGRCPPFCRRVVPQACPHTSSSATPRLCLLALLFLSSRAVPALIPCCLSLPSLNASPRVPHWSRRFSRAPPVSDEKRASAQHPNIISYVDMGQDRDGSYYIVCLLSSASPAPPHMHSRTHARERAEGSRGAANPSIRPFLQHSSVGHSTHSSSALALPTWTFAQCLPCHPAECFPYHTAQHTLCACCFPALCMTVVRACVRVHACVGRTGDGSREWPRPAAGSG